MTTAIGTASSANAPLNITGLASGLNTNEIITALLAAEREPVTRLTNKQTALEGQSAQLQSIQSGLTELSFAGQELGSPVTFNTTQSVDSSDPTQITAANSNGAAIGGYEVEVTQLANSAQRTFAFKSPVAEEAITIDGQEIHLAANASIQSLAETINANSTTVFAAALKGETLILSTRATGATGPGFIQVEDGGETLVEQAALAKAGKNAEYSVDGVAGSSSSNTVTTAIPGVTLSLKALTTTTGPVTIDVQAPTVNTSAIVAQVQSFVKLYNSAISAIGKQLSTKPPSNPQSKEELQSGTLFGDSELIGTLDSLRKGMYEPIEGLASGMSSLADIGIGTGAASGSHKVTQASVEGQLEVNTAELENALQTNPSGVEQLLAKWSTGFQAIVNAEALPGGNLEARINGDSEQVAEMNSQITFMNETIALREKTLQEQYAAMEAAIAHSQAVGNWLSSQIVSLTRSSTSGTSTAAG